MKPWQVIEMLASHVKGKYPCTSAVIAQLIIEVGFALKTPKDMTTKRESYNLGNVKGAGTAGSVTILTTEYYDTPTYESMKAKGLIVRYFGIKNGKHKCQVKDQFRAYRNYGEAISDHFALLKKPRYVRAGVWQAKTPFQFATALKTAGYATDPKYVDKIMQIVNKYQLTRFDAAEPQEAVHNVTVHAGGKEFIGLLMDAVTWIPARSLAEEGLGKQIGWDDKQKKVTANGQAIDTRIYTITGKTVGYVPVRRLCSAFGRSVNWDAATRSVHVA